MNGAPFHTAVPTPSTKAESSANPIFLFRLFCLNTAMKNISDKIIKDVINPSPRYTNAAVLAISPLDTATKNIARKLRALLFAKYFTI